MAKIKKGDLHFNINLQKIPLLPQYGLFEVQDDICFEHRRWLVINRNMCHTKCTFASQPVWSAYLCKPTKTSMKHLLRTFLRNRSPIKSPFENSFWGTYDHLAIKTSCKLCCVTECQYPTEKITNVTKRDKWLPFRMHYELNFWHSKLMASDAGERAHIWVVHTHLKSAPRSATSLKTSC